MQGLTLTVAPIGDRNLAVMGLYPKNESLPVYPELTIVDDLPCDDAWQVVLAFPKWHNATHRRFPEFFRLIALVRKSEALPSEARILPHSFPAIYHYPGVLSASNAQLMVVPMGSTPLSFEVLGYIPIPLIQPLDDTVFRSPEAPPHQAATTTSTTSRPMADEDLPDNPNIHPRFIPKVMVQRAV